jgi:hypothetical protein
MLNSEMKAFQESQREMEETAGQAEPERKPTEKGIYEKYSLKLIDAHADGIYYLIGTAMNLTGMPCDPWVAKRKVSSACDYDTLLSGIWLMVLGWDPLILQHFVAGDLPKASKTNHTLKRKLASTLYTCPISLKR